MPQPRTSNASSTIDPRVLLLAMAFGQGAGTMLATEDALQLALSKCARFLEANSSDSEEWEANALRFIEYARAVGTLAAHSAAGDLKPVIDATAVDRALGALGPTRMVAYFGACGC
jgi:succinyl-CoA synthetase beta subunit